MEITGIVSPKLPILSPWRGGDISFLPLSLNVGLLVLRGIEDRLRLLRRHTGHRSGCGRLIRSLSRGRCRVLALSAATTATAAATSPSAAAPFFPESQLVIPTRIGIR